MAVIFLQETEKNEFPHIFYHSFCFLCFSVRQVIVGPVAYSNFFSTSRGLQGRSNCGICLATKSLKMPSTIICVAVTLSMSLGVLAHMDDEMGGHSDTGEPHDSKPPETSPTSYFVLEGHEFEIQVHITLMILSWFIILPIGESLGFCELQAC